MSVDILSAKEARQLAENNRDSRVKDVLKQIEKRIKRVVDWGYFGVRICWEDYKILPSEAKVRENIVVELRSFGYQVDLFDEFVKISWSRA